ncbi:S24 family peptidase [Paracoccus sp. (in: a-proteobacteria)]|uniref:S24 family peptidase n=1 Tax=Paracoccus sp. TaxID=267 RepID=UPI00272AF064|nr:S24 family peptidase [Paracoccus sp. (in: a-proteobacteria)]
MSRVDETFAETVRTRLAELGTSPFAVETKHNLPTDALRNVLRRSKAGPTLNRVGEICEALGLELYIGPPRASAGGKGADVDGMEFAAVPRFTAQLSAGPGADHDGDMSVGAIAFRRDWLAREGISPSSAMVLPVKGDSMAPTLCDGDLVMIDRRKVTPTGRKIYALIGPDGEARVKRIERLPTALLLHSDNDGFPTELVAPSDADRIRILGQVVWWGHTARD